MAARRSPPTPKDMSASATLSVAFAKQVLGTIINTLANNGVLEKPAEAVWGALEGTVGTAVATQGIHGIVAGLETGLRMFGSNYGISHATIDIISASLDELGDSIRNAHNKHGSVSQAEGHTALQAVAKNLELKVLTTMTHDAACKQLELPEQSALEQQIAVFEAQSQAHQELWQAVRPLLCRPNDLRLLLLLPINNWRRHFTEFIQKVEAAKAKDAQAKGGSLTAGLKNIASGGSVASIRDKAETSTTELRRSQATAIRQLKTVEKIYGD